MRGWGPSGSACGRRAWPGPAPRRLADVAGERLTVGMLSKIERGRVSPSLGTLRYLAGRVGVPLSVLFGEEGPGSAGHRIPGRRPGGALAGRPGGGGAAGAGGGGRGAREGRGREVEGGGARSGGGGDAGAGEHRGAARELAAASEDSPPGRERQTPGGVG